MGASHRSRLSFAIAILTVVTLQNIVAQRALAVYGGGGAANTDCLAVFDADVNFPPARPLSIRCVDGDPTCDADGVVNGVCTFSVGVCANSTYNPSKCTLQGVQSITVGHADDDGVDPKFDPDFQLLQGAIDNAIDPPTAVADSCSGRVNIRVPIHGPFGKPTVHNCSLSIKTVKLTTVVQVIQGKVYPNDVDGLMLMCRPAPKTSNGCDPRTFFTGTYDRIQKQIFNQSCATATCHDSQTKAAALLLESGAFPANLINVVPTTASAAAAGWTRVSVPSVGVGDPTTSLLYHKIITGGLPDASYGLRMPRGRRVLNVSLQEAIRLWILSGAPDTGWVPGTD
ncbi:MAG: hypothetical protein HYR72_00435 [Deltaproteobacteria bacterium]|nr:hypothetical protein [Deltaproteobacteria bacterium]MBI3389499.1 hypothetical protein [Deltaproteobacteria bacterium]